jgi:integrase
MRTSELAEKYLSEREASGHYQWFLRRIAQQLEVAGVRRPTDFEPSLINRWLAGLHDLSATTRSNYRRGALVLWHHAHRLGHVAHPSDRVVRVKQSLKPPIAWSADELSRLMDTALGLSGEFKVSGCPKALFWSAFVRIGYETGLRPSDLHNLQASQFRGNRLFVTHRKTGAAQGKVVSVESVQLARQLIERGDHKTVFRWAVAWKWLHINFRKLADEAGVSGSIKFLRRTGATFCEASQPGSAKKFLGHLSDGLAMKYYIDQTLLPDSSPSPPPLPKAKLRKGSIHLNPAS